MKNLKKILLMLLVFAGMLSTAKADGAKINVRIKGLSNDSIFLGYHFSDKKYVIDTVVTNEKGEAVFENDEKWPGGIYIIVLPTKTYFEILLTDVQKFSIETDTSDLVMNMKVTGSKENELFIAYHNYMHKANTRSGELREKLNTLKDKADSTEIVTNEIIDINKEIKDYQKKLIEKNPGTTIAVIISALLEPDVPEPPVDAEGKPLDPDFRYKYYKAHYFDFVDLSDSCLLRTPFFFPRIDYYLDRLVMNIPDSLMREVDMILNKAESSKMMMQNLTGHLSYKYETHKVMGMDKIFVYIGEKYYLNHRVEADTSFLNKLKPRIDAITPCMIGKVAKDLKLMNEKNQWVTLHAIKADYTILAFWEPACGHCKKEIPKLKLVYDTLQSIKVDVKVLAVCTQRDTAEWKKIIKEKDLNWINAWDAYNNSMFRDNYDIYSTPVVYVLDKDKTIIYKRISVENIVPALLHDLGREAEIEELRKKPEKRPETGEDEKPSE